MDCGDEGYCRECGRSTITVTDYSSGDVVCTECGLVLEAWIVDTSQEWRSFCHDEINWSSDIHNRVGARVNPLLDGCSPAPTLVSRPPPGRRHDSPPPSSSVTTRLADDSANALSRIDAISDMSDALGLVPSVKLMAMDVYKKVDDSKTFARKNRDTLPAACLFVACRLEQYPRTLNEILLVAQGSTKKKLAQDVKFIEQLLSKMGRKEAPATARDFLARFSSNLCLGNDFIKAATEAMTNLEKLDIRRTPASLAAGIIYMMTQLSDARPLQAISMASQVSEITILKTYKDLYPHASVLMPASFATEERLRNIFWHS